MLFRNGFGLQHYDTATKELYDDLWIIDVWTTPRVYAAGREPEAKWYASESKAQKALDRYSTNATVVALKRPSLMVLLRRMIAWKLVAWAKKVWPHPMGY